MAEVRTKRKLAAILSADVKGYSRLMEDDEEATVCTVTQYREVMTDLIQGNNSRVVDAKGDNVLVEFPSVVDAVRRALLVAEMSAVSRTDHQRQFMSCNWNEVLLPTCLVTNHQNGGMAYRTF